MECSGREFFDIPCSRLLWETCLAAERFVGLVTEVGVSSGKVQCVWAVLLVVRSPRLDGDTKTAVAAKVRCENIMHPSRWSRVVSFSSF
jgi:hypothetical protein